MGVLQPIHLIRNGLDNDLDKFKIDMKNLKESPQLQTPHIHFLFIAFIITFHFPFLNFLVFDSLIILLHSFNSNISKRQQPESFFFFKPSLNKLTFSNIYGRI